MVNNRVVVAVTVAITVEVTVAVCRKCACGHLGRYYMTDKFSDILVLPTWTGFGEHHVVLSSLWSKEWNVEDE